MVHTESPPEVVAMADVAGGTGDMMNAVKSAKWKTFVVVTEDGMTDRFRIEFPDFRFIALGSVCPHMKMVGLDEVLQVLELPRPDQVCEIPDAVRMRAAAAIDRMFEFTGQGRDESRPHSNAGDVS
jgi:quinolinate synthase